MTFAADQSLTDERRAIAKVFAIIGGFFLLVAAGTYFYGLDTGTAFPRDGSTLVVGRNFLNFWMYGRAAVMPDPGHWYDPVAYAHALGALLGPGYLRQNWYYPPRCCWRRRSDRSAICRRCWSAPCSISRSSSPSPLFALYVGQRHCGLTLASRLNPILMVRNAAKLRVSNHEAPVSRASSFEMPANAGSSG